MNTIDCTMFAAIAANRKEHRLRDGAGLLSIMQEYSIYDAASCVAAIKQVNAKF